MLNFNSILLFSEKPESLAAFYGQLADAKPVMEGGGYTTYLYGSGAITIGPHDKVHGKNQHPERMLINFETKDVEAEFKRVKDLGAHVVQEPYHPNEAEDMQIATFADPDGNFIQLITPWKE
jgi:predicted enzyme related to lactoylglutathione lyase